MRSLDPAPEVIPLIRWPPPCCADAALPELRKTKMRDDWRKLAADLKEDPDKVALQIKELIDRISAQELDHLLNREEDQTPVPGRIESTELAASQKIAPRSNRKRKSPSSSTSLEDLFTSGLSLELQHQYLAAVAALVRSSKSLCHRGFGERLLCDLPAIS